MSEKFSGGRCIVVTGAAGYVGAMLVDQFSKRPDVRKIIAIDKDPRPDLLNSISNLIYIEANVADDNWQEKVQSENPDTIIHAAWQIREIYGDRALQRAWNIGGSENVFDFSFSLPSVKKIVFFSTVAVYGAFKENTLTQRFTEDDLLRAEDYLYGVEKKEAEEILKEKHFEMKEKGNVVQVAIIRPASITGPRGKFMRESFGLQAALAGKLRKTFLNSIIHALVVLMPITKKWCRQFIHEDDICNITEILTFRELSSDYEVFNACPPGDIVTGKEMAQIVKKRTITMPMWVIRFGFFIARHFTLGKIPTSPGLWKFYGYPIVVDGSKITSKYDYAYLFSPMEAFTKMEGRYMKYVTEKFLD